VIKLILTENITEYKKAVAKTLIPWQFVAAIHWREASCDLTQTLKDGASLSASNLWASDARRVFKERELHLKRKWDICRLLYRLEEWNGWGYYKKGVHSAYLWGGTELVSQGMFVADGKYDRSLRDLRYGAAVVLRGLLERSNLNQGLKLRIEYDADGEYIGPAVFAWQRALNRWWRDVLQVERNRLVVDGWAGPETSSATKFVFGRYLKGDPREGGKG